MLQDDVWLIGAGEMAMEYAKVLKALKVNYTVIGRGKQHANRFRLLMKKEVYTGGIDEFINDNQAKPKAAIVAVGVENLSEVTIRLIRYGVRRILVEKPGIAYPSEMSKLFSLQKKHKTRVLLAYNRRFYASTRRAREIIQKDGGVLSFVFEFTEWSHLIGKARKTKAEWHNWFLGNSTHVIDTAFFLGGKPKKMVSFVKGKLKWHPKSSIFAGAGETTKGAFFSYYANWEAPGRWSVEIMTKKHRLILQPMESLKIQNVGSIDMKTVPIDYSLDKKYKPGLYRQTKAFLNAEYDNFCTLQDQQAALKFYRKMSSY